MGTIAIWKGRYRRLALVGFLLFATSPLFSLGTLYQLIAQVGGHGAPPRHRLASSSRRAGPAGARRPSAGILTAGLGDLLPGGVARSSPWGSSSWPCGCASREPRKLKRYVLFIAGVAVLTFVLIASSTYEFINTLVMQSMGSAGLGAMAEINDQSGGLVLFPWTLVPSFIPMLFGLHPFGKVGDRPPDLVPDRGRASAFLVYFAWRTWRNFADGGARGLPRASS